MATNTLTDATIKAVKTEAKPVKLFDGAGLFVLVKPTGAKFDLTGDEPTWRIPAARTKTRREHVVPLASQVVATLSELHPLTGPDGLVFPSLREYERVTSRLSPVQDGTLVKDDPAADRAARELVADE